VRISECIVGKPEVIWRGEQHLIATAPAWTILRMNYYAEALVQQAGDDGDLAFELFRHCFSLFWPSSNELSAL
jgi:hypothetical protein